MQVNLKESEIARAVELYLNRHGIKTRGKAVTIQFSMGKGANGLRTEINIEGLDDNHDDQLDVPLFTHNVYGAQPQVLETLELEPEVRPGTLGALIKNHTETVHAHIEREAEAEDDAQPVAEVEQAVEVQVEEVEAAAAIEAEAEATGAPWNEAPVEEAAAEPSLAEAGDDEGVGIPTEVEQAEEVSIADQQLAAEPEAVAEPVVEAAPITAPLRRPIFGKKPVMAAPEPEAVVAEEAAPAVEVEVKPAAIAAPPRRTSTLFKKPAA